MLSRRFQVHLLVDKTSAETIVACGLRRRQFFPPSRDPELVGCRACRKTTMYQVGLLMARQIRGRWL